MIFLYLVLSLDKTIEGINSILPIVSYRNISLSETENVCTRKYHSWSPSLGGGIPLLLLLGRPGGCLGSFLEF